MVKLAYTQVLGTCARKGVRVRVPPRPLKPMPDYETWEQMKNAIRPLFAQGQVLVEDQLLLQNIQSLDPFSLC